MVYIALWSQGRYQEGTNGAGGRGDQEEQSRSKEVGRQAEGKVFGRCNWSSDWPVDAFWL